MYDQKVVRLVMQGDAKAFHRLYDDCADSVYAWAYDMLRDGELAREALRRVFVDIFRLASRLKDPSLFDEWAYRLTIYHCGEIAVCGRNLREESRRREWEAISQSLDLQVNPEEFDPRAPFHGYGEEDSEWDPILFPPDEEDNGADWKNEPIPPMMAELKMPAGVLAGVDGEWPGLELEGDTERAEKGDEIPGEAPLWFAPEPGEDDPEEQPEEERTPEAPLHAGEAPELREMEIMAPEEIEAEDREGLDKGTEITVPEEPCGFAGWEGQGLEPVQSAAESSAPGMLCLADGQAWMDSPGANGNEKGGGTPAEPQPPQESMEPRPFPEETAVEEDRRPAIPEADGAIELEQELSGEKAPLPEESASVEEEAQEQPMPEKAETARTESGSIEKQAAAELILEKAEAERASRRKKDRLTAWILGGVTAGLAVLLTTLVLMGQGVWSTPAFLQGPARIAGEAWRQFLGLFVK